MKKSIAILTVLLFTGCLFPVSQALRDILHSFNDFTVIGDQTSYDARTLKQHIPEYEPVFFEFGVDSCLVAEFGRGNEKYTVDIYSFPNLKSAMGAYLIMNIPDSQLLKIGMSARRSNTTVHFVKEKYFVMVQTMNGSSIDGAVELAKGIGKRIKESEIKPDIFQTLPTANQVKDSEFYFRGPKAFTRRYGNDLCNALLIENALEGIAAKYMIEKSEVEVIRIKFPGRERTLEAVDSYLRSRRDRPILHSQENYVYYTVVEENNKEVYVSELVDVLLIMFGGQSFGPELKFFEFLLRGGR